MTRPAKAVQSHENSSDERTSEPEAICDRCEVGDPPVGSRLWRCEHELTKARAQLETIRQSVTAAPFPAGMYLIDKGYVDALYPPVQRTHAEPGRGRADELLRQFRDAFCAWEQGCDARGKTRALLNVLGDVNEYLRSETAEPDRWREDMDRIAVAIGYPKGANYGDILGKLDEVMAWHRLSGDQIADLCDEARKEARREAIEECAVIAHEARHEGSREASHAAYAGGYRNASLYIAMRIREMSTREKSAEQKGNDAK